MTKRARRYGTAIGAITHPDTSQVEALIYQWDNGDTSLVEPMPGSLGQETCQSGEPAKAVGPGRREPRS
ncbi:hypothetical protein [Rubellimicrobium aerolatum]|uniref:Uncharacterized protein n=1 Tax=Rubellimicrobium aerolatum TaxID=490979 RepID=A0ABW0SDT4_9RHOB|nr:hypothetical protein [Rubellimicrobium aerolatum]MBP1807675.1 hypothetical protein [Rubellimicrobium aerolatum]